MIVKLNIYKAFDMNVFIVFKPQHLTTFSFHFKLHKNTFTPSVTTTVSLPMEYRVEVGDTNGLKVSAARDCSWQLISRQPTAYGLQATADSRQVSRLFIVKLYFIAFRCYCTFFVSVVGLPLEIS